MYERRYEPLLPRRAFFRRLARHGALAACLMLSGLVCGMLGYHFLERLPWIDAYVNAAMILSGMGPLDSLHTSAGKIFAGIYALFSGVAFLSTVGLLLAPVVHRAVHKFHLQGKSRSD
jgi:hypothetical protein